MPTLLFAGKPADWNAYQNLIPASLERRGIKATLTQNAAPEEVDYIIYTPNGPVRDFEPFTKLKAVLSLWAGVERIIGNQTLKVPLCRMSDDGLKVGMSEWVTGHVLRYHLGMDAHIINPSHSWAPGVAPPLAHNRSVAILGLGELGLACATMLKGVGFKVSGWSRTLKAVEGITCYARENGLKDILSSAEIVVLLLPQTPQTTHIINEKSLSIMPRGAKIINPGRGPLIEDEALLAALNSGQIGHATLDVFATEPLPQTHPYWKHKNVTVTPHIAAETRPETAAEVIAENIARGESGQAFVFEVDRASGY